MRPREVSAKNRGPALLLSAWIVHVAIVLGLRFVMNWAYDDVPPLDESWVVPATQFILLGAGAVAGVAALAGVWLTVARWRPVVSIPVSVVFGFPPTLAAAAWVYAGLIFAGWA